MRAAGSIGTTKGSSKSCRGRRKTARADSVRRFRSGGPQRCLISQHVALNGDDGSAAGAVRWSRSGEGIVLVAPPDSEVGTRFPSGAFRVTPLAGTQIERIGADELLFIDGRSRAQPYLCIMTAPAPQLGIAMRGELVKEADPPPLRAASTQPLTPAVKVRSGAAEPHRRRLEGLAELAPWFAQNAWVHYLSPRGLEQYSGGGWGTRDVCQGPVEMLLALGRPQPIRDLLLRVMRQQNPDGDWPQWFMFFERERNIRPGDSHGDIVFWPLLVAGAVPDCLRLTARCSMKPCPSSMRAVPRRASARASGSTSSGRSR